MQRPTLKLSATTRARYERRNGKRRKVHLANGDMRPACGAVSNTPLQLSMNQLASPTVTCETCLLIIAKGAL